MKNEIRTKISKKKRKYLCFIYIFICVCNIAGDKSGGVYREMGFFRCDNVQFKSCKCTFVE